MDIESPYLSIVEAESLRFGLRIARGTIPSCAPNDTAARGIRALKPDVAIVRLDAGDHHHIQPLIDEGLMPLHADTLVYYETDLDSRREALGTEQAQLIRPAMSNDAEALAQITKRSFSGYRSHYQANHRFAAEEILKGYVEWALSYLNAQISGRQTWIIETKSGSIAGYATCREDISDKQVEIVLNAIDPEHMRAGHYGRLLQGILDYYRQNNFRSLRVSTQVWNFPVQRVWSRAGLMIKSAFDTYHINLPSEH